MTCLFWPAAIVAVSLLGAIGILVFSVDRGSDRVKVIKALLNSWKR